MPLPLLALDDAQGVYLIQHVDAIHVRLENEVVGHRRDELCVLVVKLQCGQPAVVCVPPRGEQLEYERLVPQG